MPTIPGPAPEAVERALAEAEHIGRRAAAEQALARWFGRIEYARGYRAGYEAASADMAEAWAAAASPIARGGPSHAELERRRWGPAGRARFGDPRPADRYPQREGAA